MKKIIVLLALCMPLVGYANGNLVAKVSAAAKKTLREAPTTWKGLNKGIEISSRVYLQIRDATFATNKKVAALRADFDARKAMVAANQQKFEELLRRAQSSALPVPLTKEDLNDLFTLDAYGPNPTNEFVTLPQYYATLPPDTEGFRPTVTTKQDFYAYVDDKVHGPMEVFIPAGSEVQLGGKLTPYSGEAFATDWIAYVAFILNRTGGERASALRKTAKLPAPTKDAIFTKEHIINLMASPYADQVFSPVFLVGEAGSNVRPAMVSRIPLRITDQITQNVEAGTIFEIWKDRSGGIYGGYCGGVSERNFVRAVNHMTDGNKIRYMAPLKELFVTEKAPNGETVYHPQMLMLWETEDGWRIIGPQNTLNLTGAREAKKLVLLDADKAIPFDDFREAVKAELPDEAEVLAGLPDKPADDWHVFNLKEVGMVEQPYDRLGASFDDVDTVFGYGTPINDIRTLRDAPLTVEDLQDASNYVAQQRGLPGLPVRRVRVSKPLTEASASTVQTEKVTPVQAEEVTPLPPVATSQTTNIAPLQEPVKPKGVSMDAKVPNRIPKGIDPKWVDSEPAVFYDKHDRSNSRKRFVVWEVVEGFKLPDGTVANKKDYVQDRDGKIIVYSGAVFRNNYVRAF